MAETVTVNIVVCAGVCLCLCVRCARKILVESGVGDDRFSVDVRAKKESASTGGFRPQTPDQYTQAGVWSICT